MGMMAGLLSVMVLPPTYRCLFSLNMDAWQREEEGEGGERRKKRAERERH